MKLEIQPIKTGDKIDYAVRHFGCDKINIFEDELPGFFLRECGKSILIVPITRKTGFACEKGGLSGRIGKVSQDHRFD